MHINLSYPLRSLEGSREEGDIEMFITLVPKFYDSLVYQLWRVLLNFDRLFHKVESPNVSFNNYNLQKGQFCLSSLGMKINSSAFVLSLYIPGRKASFLRMGIQHTIFNYITIMTQGLDQGFKG